MQKIAEISNRSGGSLRVYDNHLKKSAELLRDAVGSVNDALTERKLNLEALVERRLERGRDEPGNAEKDLSEAVARMQGSVAETTVLLEKSARTTIDRQMELEDEREALRTMAQRLAVRQIEDRQRQLEREQAVRAADSGSGRRRKQRRGDGDGTKREGGGDGDGDKNEEGSDNGNDDDDDDDDDDATNAQTNRGPPPPASAVSILAEERGVRAAAYAELGAYQKYSLNNDYIAFKQAWHYGMFPDSDVPLPDASHWFNAAGEPARYGPNRGGNGDEDNNGGSGSNGAQGNTTETGNGDGGNDEDEDDDLVVQREVISFKCPLSLVTMKDPYRSKKCKHTFERSAIIEYLCGGPPATRNQPKKCPQTGCVVEFTSADLVPDTVMRQRILHAAQMERRRQDAAAATSDIEGDEDEDVHDVDEMSFDASQRRTKAEIKARSIKRERFQRTQ